MRAPDIFAPSRIVWVALEREPNFCSGPFGQPNIATRRQESTRDRLDRMNSARQSAFPDAASDRHAIDEYERIRRRGLDPNRGIRPEVDLSKYDPSARVSRRHARIVAQGTQFYIEDLGSANGTVVNGSLKLSQGKPHMLISGDELKLGETTLKFVVS